VPDTTKHPRLTERFKEAFDLAWELHRSQRRKGSGVPYMSHLMSVASLVLENGGVEDEAIAALLHDALEDTPHRITAEDIERRFGSRVRAIVEACTDTEPGFAGGEKSEWRSRKEAYIGKVRSAPETHRVSLADKVHNMRCILRDYRAEGEALWGRFKGGRDGTLWYYLELAKAYRDAGATGYLLQELEESAQQLKRNVHELEGGAHEPGDPAQGT